MVVTIDWICSVCGDNSYSKNELEDLICNHCGTRSLQKVNETNEGYDQRGGEGSHVSNLRLSRRKQTKTNKTKEKKKKKRKRKREDNKNSTNGSDIDCSDSSDSDSNIIELSSCLEACQIILKAFTQSLIEKANFPSIFHNIIRDIWFLFLKTYALYGERPLLHSFMDNIEFYKKKKLNFGKTEKEANWDKKFIKQINVYNYDNKNLFLLNNRFRYNHLISLLYLGSRILNMGLIPSDFYYMCHQNIIPYFNGYYDILPNKIKETIYTVRLFFIGGRQRIIRPADIEINARHIQINIEKISSLNNLIPPLNPYKVIIRMIEHFNLPYFVFLMFKRLVIKKRKNDTHNNHPVRKKYHKVQRDYYNMGLVYEDDETFLNSATGLAAMIIIAIKFCPGWHMWIHVIRNNTNNKDDLIFNGNCASFLEETENDGMWREDMDDYCNFLEKNVYKFCDLPKSIKKQTHDLLNELKNSMNVTTDHKGNKITNLDKIQAYYPVYINGVPVIPDISNKTKTNEINEKNDNHMDPFYYPKSFNYLIETDEYYPSPLDKLFHLFARYIDIPYYVIASKVKELERIVFERLKKDHHDNTDKTKV